MAASTTNANRLTDAERDEAAKHIGLLVLIANKRKTREMSFDDAMQAGAIGLMKAVRWFDPSKGFKFATFATRCIHNEISVQQRKKGLIHTPQNGGQPIRVASLDAMKDNAEKEPASPVRGYRRYGDDAVADLYAEIEKLPFLDRDVVCRTAFTDEAPTRIADRLGIGVANINFIKLRTHRRLKAKLAKYA